MKNDPRYLLDYDRPVEVYRNLHKGCWSIRQDGLVKAHTDMAFLFNPRFVVRDNARLRVNERRRKNVHAWLSGILHENPSRVREIGNPHWRMVTYDPYKYKSFVTKSDKQPVNNAKQAWMMTPYVWIKQ